jgi:hypothetical protein
MTGARQAAFGLALAAALALGTAVLGWWAVPALGAVWGLTFTEGRGRVLLPAAAALVAWAGLLAWTGTRGPVLRVTEKVAGIFGIPAFTIVLLALVFPALLAGSAAGAAGGLRELVGRGRSAGSRATPTS